MTSGIRTLSGRADSGVSGGIVFNTLEVLMEQAVCRRGGDQ